MDNNYNISLNPILRKTKGCNLCDLSVQDLIHRGGFKVEDYYKENGNKKHLSSFIKNYLNTSKIDIIDIIFKIMEDSEGSEAEKPEKETEAP